MTFCLFLLSAQHALRFPTGSYTIHPLFLTEEVLLTGRFSAPLCKLSQESMPVCGNSARGAGRMFCWRHTGEWYSVNHLTNSHLWDVCLVVQWLRTRLPVQGRELILVPEDPMRGNNKLCTTLLLKPAYWSLCLQQRSHPKAMA